MLLVLWFLLFLHLSVQLFSFLEDFHEFAVHLVAIQLLKNVFLVLELVLWLLGLLSSHLVLQR